MHRDFDATLRRSPVTVHYLRGDPDHNRTVTAFSGTPHDLAETLLELAERAFASVDLRRHDGAHPRLGALDVLPFVCECPVDFSATLAFVEDFGMRLAERFDLPVFLYERSERGRHESDLPTLRKGGFAALAERELRPDFGPARAHPRLGATVLGVRDPLVALNVDLRHPMATVAKAIAREIRVRRAEGDPIFLGVRALGLPLPSREMSQVSLNVTLPDLTPLDSLVEWIEARALAMGVASAGAELVGVIPEACLGGASRVPYEASQVV